MSTLWDLTHGTSVYLYAATSVLLLGALAFVYHVFALGEPKIPKGLRAAPSPPGARLFSGHSHIYSGQVTNNPTESQLVKWAEELGEIYQIRMGTQRWIVLSSPEAVKVGYRINSESAATRADRLFQRKSLIGRAPCHRAEL